MLETLNAISVNWYILGAAFAFICLDFITGFAQACANHCISSEKLREGLWHKCGFVLAIFFGVLCEWSMQFVDLGFTVPVGTCVCVYIIIAEMTSIIENLGKLSPALAASGFLKFFPKHNVEDDEK